MKVRELPGSNVKSPPKLPGLLLARPISNDCERSAPYRVTRAREVVPEPRLASVLMMTFSLEVAVRARKAAFPR